MMNNKVLVEISVPSTGDSFDVYIPLDIRTHEALVLISRIMEDITDGKYFAKNDAVLCNAETGIIYNLNTEVAELNIKNGSHLLLI